MAKSANTIKKIAAIAAAMTMMMSTFGTVASAKTEDLSDDYSTEETTERVSVSRTNVKVKKGEKVSVVVTVNGSKNLKTASTNTKIAKAKWSSDGFKGNSVVLYINGLSRGTAKIKIKDKKTNEVLKTINVTVESDEVLKSNNYTAAFTVYSFATGCYYMNKNDALKDSALKMEYIYVGEVSFSKNASAGYPYYNKFTGLYYPNYEMALAAGGGNRTYVSMIEVSSKTYGNGFTYYNFKTRLYYKSFNDALAAANLSQNSIYNGKLDETLSADGNHRFFSSATNRYYTTYEMALAASDGFTGYVSQVEVQEIKKSETYSAQFPYYSFATSYYYMNQADAIKDSNGQAGFVYYGQVTFSGTESPSYPYYNYYTGLYYPNYEMALAAGGGNRSFVRQTQTATSSDTYSDVFCYYSFATFKYYSSWDAANTASGYDSAAIYRGKISYDIKPSQSYPYLCKYDYKYYPNYEMALAAAHGVAMDVEYQF